MEIWKDIQGYESKYQISNTGKVKSLRRDIFLKPYMCEGYLKVDLYISQKRRKVFIHQLVGENFVDNPENKKTVNHKDGNRLNNNDWNLEWSSYSEQELHKNRVISGHRRGVYWHKKSQKWTVHMTIDKKTNYLGIFTDKEDAYQAFYNKYLEIYGVEPWNT